MFGNVRLVNMYHVQLYKACTHYWVHNKQPTQMNEDISPDVTWFVCQLIPLKLLPKENHLNSRMDSAEFVATEHKCERLQIIVSSASVKYLVFTTVSSDNWNLQWVGVILRLSISVAFVTHAYA